MKNLAHLIGLIWVTVALTLAYTGVKLIPQLVILGLIAVTGGLQGIFWEKAWRRYLVAPLIVLMILGASMVSFIQLGMWLFPPVTPDGHGVMAIGQTLGGIALGFLLCVLLSWFYFTRLKPDPRLEAIWVYITFVVLAVTFVVDYLN